MKIAIIGQQAFGKSVLDAFHERGDHVAGVFCAPEKPGSRPDPLRVTAGERNLRVFQLPSLKGEEADRIMRELDVDLAVMAYVLQFAPQSFVNIPRHGTIQYHPSLLPLHRGPSSINWPIIQGARQTGVTIFRPTDGLDEGPIVLQKSVEIAPHDTVGSLYFERLFPMGVAAMLEAADLVVCGKHSETPQDESMATYEGWCRDAEARISWHAPVNAVHNLIRGCSPAPGAWIEHAGNKLRVLEASKQITRSFGEVAGKPGEIVAIGEQGLTIAAQGGTVELLKLRPDGAEKISGAAFAAAAGLKPGMRLGAAETSASQQIPGTGSEKVVRRQEPHLRKKRLVLQPFPAWRRTNWPIESAWTGLRKGPFR